MAPKPKAQDARKVGAGTPPVAVARAKGFGSTTSTDRNKAQASAQLIKMRPKTGMPRLLRSQLMGLVRMVLLLIVAANMPRLMALKEQAEAHGGEPSDGHEHGGEAEHGHGGGHEHHDTHILDLQATLGIVVVLITVTIIFEKAKHHLEHTVPPLMSAVLAALFGELTVLGFIALYAFFMLQTGVLNAISVLLYGDGDHLLHLFEAIHFALFFVMVIFLFQAYTLVRTLIVVEAVWMENEAMLRANRRGPAPAISQLLATYKAARFNCCRLCCLRPLWSYRVSEARDDLRYALLRERFVAPPRCGPNETPLPSDFDFSAYLRRRGAHLVTHVLHVSTHTWLFVLVFLCGVLETPVVLEMYGVTPTVEAVVLLGWLVWLTCVTVQAKIDRINGELMPRHALLTTAPAAEDDDEAPTALLVEPPSHPSYESRPPHPRRGKHQGLFWGGRDGPERLIFIVRTLLLISAVTLAVIFEWLSAHPEDMLHLLLALVPVLDVMLGAPMRLLPGIVLATSTEQLKNAGDIKATLLEMKTEKTLRMLKLFSMLQAQARRAKKLQGGGAKKAKPKELDPAQVSELRQAFEFFDKDKSGSIDKTELMAVLRSLGMDMSESDMAILCCEMDPSGDGVIDFSEFCAVMGQDPNDKQSPEEVAESIFSILDKDKSGSIKTSEFKAALVGMDTGLSDEDIEASMQLFDQNRSGSITKHEFVQTIEMLNTFA